MITVSLRAAITRADFGPFRLGATKEELLRSVGHPDQAGYPHDGEDAVWKYGDLELLFDSTSRPFRVWCVELHAFEDAPTGGRRVRIDPWIVRNELPLARFLAALDGLGVAYRQEVPAYDANAVNVVVCESPRVHVDFVAQTEADYGPPAGLYGVWMTRT